MTTTASSDDRPSTVEESLRLGAGFADGERDHVVERLAGLDPRLRSFSTGSVELLLTVKERDRASQRTTLEAWVAGSSRVVATSDREDLDAALAEVRDDLTRQLTDAKNRTEPRQNRHRREVIPPR